jgi:hypothetical protein
MLHSLLPPKEMTLNQDELLQLIELVRSNNEYNDEDDVVEYWDTVIGKLYEMVEI